MIASPRHVAPAVLLVGLGPLAGLGAAWAEPRPIAVEASGAIALEGERQLRIEGVRGQVQVRGGEAGVLKFFSSVRGDQEQELPVALFAEGRTLVLRGPEGEATRPRLLWVSLPEELELTIELEDSEVTLVDVPSELSIRGGGLQVVAKRLAADAALRLEGGQARILRAAGAVTLEGHDFQADLLRITGPLELSAEAARIRAREIGGPVRIELEESALALGGLGSMLDDPADGEQDAERDPTDPWGREEGEDPPDAAAGSAKAERDEDLERLVETAGGGTLHLQKTPLTLTRSRGVILVETDADVTLTDNDADVRIRGYEMGVRASGHRGPLAIDGEQLAVELKLLSGDLSLAVSSSNVDVEQSFGAVTARSDFGDVSLRDVRGAIEVESRGGNVIVQGAREAVQVSADGERVEVGWDQTPRETDCTIVNETGDVSVLLPASARMRLDARTQYGRIETAFAGVRINEDGDRAVGVINRGGRVTLRIEAGGDVQVLRAGSGGAAGR